MMEARPTMIAAKPQKLDFPALRDPRYPVRQIADQVEPYLRLIVERFHPEKIILFGSQVSGHPSVDSDVDLLIICPEVTSEREMNRQIRAAFWEISGPRLPFTLLTKTPRFIEERLAEGSAFYHDILNQGVVVYAA
ncbi:nucleotidyltransferase domain-containing protein [Fontisphaera persica]|uniref:nucleotidyltransferase domain-containing protein n=1 Tax=Fontisphaera persica TaxID=2974023 RepID=UPI0024BFD35E|nr:nucleotidyltransferase domain-containing protein [Fontisphaera persica]WCJ58163.1 nucleotidyltransferase domain-containing protein [Fontisphaera persica]